MCLSRITPTLSPARWNELDCKLSKSISNLHHLLGHDQIKNDVAAESFGQILSDFLENETEFKEVEKEFFKKKTATSLEEAKVLKAELKKKARSKKATSEDKENFQKAVRLYSFLLKKQHEKEGECKIRKHENAYRKNFYKFAKDACNGTLDGESVKPKFKEDEAFRFYSGRYSASG